MSLMLTELCGYLRNWFECEKIVGDFTIRDGVLYAGSDAGAVALDKLLNDQYYRIVGSVLNDGVHKHVASDLKDEVFNGAVWAMAIPEVVVALADQIEAWRAKFEAVDSAAMSPFQSESFGGYSYSKGSGGASSGSSGGSPYTWQSVFAARLNQWKKL